MAKHVRISLLGYPAPTAPFGGDYEAHVLQMQNYLAAQLREVLPDQPDLIVLPEACDRFPAFPMEQRKEYYRVRGNRIRDFLSETARKHHCYIAYSACRYLPEETRNPFRNCTQIIGRDGNVAGVSNKNHLVPSELDKGEIAYGTEAPVFDLDFGRVGCAICFDLNYMELMRRYAEQKPQLILFSSMYHGGMVQQEWAYNCRAYFAGAVCGDQCRVLNPFGEEQFTSTNYQRYITGTVNLDYMLAHIDHNRADGRFRAAKEKYGSLLTIHDPGHIGAVMLTYEGTDKTVWDIVKEFEIEPLDDYFNRCRAHRSAALSAEDIP